MRGQAATGQETVLSGVRRSSRGEGRLGEGGLALLVDTLATGVLAFAISLAICTSMVFDGGVLVNALFVLLSLGILLLARLRRWVGPCMVLVAAIGTAAWLLSAGEEGRDIAGFVWWFLDGAPAGTRYFEGMALDILHFVMVFLITLAGFAMVRRFFFYPLVLALTAAVFVPLYFWGYHPDMQLCLAVSGLVVLLPRAYHRHILSGGKGQELSRASMQIAAAPVALCLVLVLLAVPEDTSPWQSRGLLNLVDDLAHMVQGPFRYGGGVRSNFDLSSTGYTPLGDRLGGPVETDSRRVLGVQASQPLLLKGSVQDEYTGQGWRDGGLDGDFRWNSLFWRGYRSQAFDWNRPPATREAAALYEGMTAALSLRVAYANSSHTTLFYGGKPQALRFSSSLSDLEVYFDIQSELYTHYRMPVRQYFDLETRVYNRHLDTFDRDMERLEQLLSGYGDSHYEEVAARYTQLPEDFPREVAALAAQVSAGEPAPYRKARALENWLSENCTYTLTPAVPPEDVDFVAHFLDTREGYCTYYASAMAVMARCVGLPSRYVSGFGLRQVGEGTESSYYAANDTAHAWAEIYFSGIGWVEFDPLQWNAAWVPEPEEEEQHAPAPFGGEEPEEESGTIPALPVAEVDEGGGDGDPTVLWLLLGGALGTAAVIFGGRWALQWLMGLPVRRYALQRIGLRFADRGAGVSYLYRDIARQLALLGERALPGDTLSIFARRADRHIHVEDAAMDGVSGVVERLRYGNLTPTREELEAVWAYHAGLEQLLRKRMNSAQYFWHRVIRGSTKQLSKN